MKTIPFTIAILSLLASGAVGCATAGDAKSGEQRIAISVTRKGFEPATVKVQAGRPVVLVVTRRVEKTCATEMMIKDHQIRQALPLNKPVEIRFTPGKPGKLRYACGMDMLAGVLVVE
ncbi:MAG: cupredoxin domain-containing protein [Candidatus Eisenbacteria bacterium]|nr:cupredoxin domain-containing protein [Candidatus Eisenbacteria bacterium]